MSQPLFSLLHATARLPDGWKEAYWEWHKKCSNPDSIEYVLGVDQKDISLCSSSIEEPDIRLVINKNRPCPIDAWNICAKVSSGKILIVVADDWFPCEAWDQAILKAVPDPDKEVVVWPKVTQASFGIMVCPILTRAYYKRPGRGGHPNGELFYPGYISVGGDDDFTAVARRDKVVKVIQEEFYHRHYSTRQRPRDSIYQYSNRIECWKVRARLLLIRKAENYQK